MENLPILTTEELRVLGVLIEKEKATPEYYPMTSNSIMNACNQKSSRNPVVNYDEVIVQMGIDGLKKRGIVLTVTGGGSRSLKYKHNSSIVFDLDDKEEAILCLLLLRGPQTIGELKTNSGRLYEFSSLEEVALSLEQLSQKELPMVKILPKLAGQKEARYMHLLGGEIDLEEYQESSHQPIFSSTSQLLEDRIQKLEVELEEMKQKMTELLKLLD